MPKPKLLLTPLLTGLLLAAIWIAAGRWQGRTFHSALAQEPARYVSTSGVDAGGCTDSAAPCRSIQYAVDQAAPGDAVLIATGVYTGINDQGGLAQVAYIDQSISLTGGYNPPDWTNSDPLAYPTTLDAQSQGRVVTVIGAIDVSISGLRLTNGQSAGLGGLYIGQYTCGRLFGGSGGGGGLCVQQAAVTLDQLWVLTSTAGTAGGRGGGIFASAAVLTLTNSTIQGNQAGTGYNRSYGGGLFAAGSSAWISGTTFLNNNANPNYDSDGGGAYFIDGQAWLQDNRIEGNRARGDVSSPSGLGGGGVAVSGGAVTLAFNQIISNTSSGNTGGGVAWSGGAITLTANLVLSNSASWGGGLYAGNTPAGLDNNVLADNTADSHGSALYIKTFNPNTARLRHNTIARNSGGDGAAIYAADYASATFSNTIIANNVIGVGLGWSTALSFNRTLWSGNITDTLGAIGDVGHLSGSAAFAADGYHLSEASDAVDAGLNAGVPADVDGEIRPQGGAPDVGADESPFGEGAGGGEVSVGQLALAPRLLLATHGGGGMPEYLIQQEYLVEIANGLSGTALATYSVTADLPTELQFASQVHFPEMDFSAAGNRLSWIAQAPLPEGSRAWLAMVGNAGPEDGGKTISNTTRAAYTPAGGAPVSLTLLVSGLIPNFPPFITTPEKGEYCLDQNGNLEIHGLAKPSAEVYLYEDSVYRMQTTASVSGTFYAAFAPAQWGPGTPIQISARDCSGGPCGQASNLVSVRQPAGGWCPQRSLWEGVVGSTWYRWPFRAANGEMTTQDWEIPGAFGFYNTTLTVYQCDPPDEGYQVTEIAVEADGIMVQDDDGAPSPDGGWSFSIGFAHSVNIIVSAENAIGDTKTYSGWGGVLVDPDGFIFDVSEGLEVISSTPDGVPLEVANALPGVTVTCMVSMPQWGGWVVWPARFYENQVNPQVTGDNGYFAFFTPPGFYYLDVQGTEGYQSWRSPVIQVITEIVHVNVPLTPWADGETGQVALLPGGPVPAVITVPLGGRVEWIAALPVTATLAELAGSIQNPFLQARSGGALDPLTSTLGIDSGRLAPGQVYRRRFSVPGTYIYSSAAGQTGTITVTGGPLFLPLVTRQADARQGSGAENRGAGNRWAGDLIGLAGAVMLAGVRRSRRAR